MNPVLYEIKKAKSLMEFRLFLNCCYPATNPHAMAQHVLN
jgi:hypothetical protein